MKQNKNFNFQSMSSANEKMLIIFSWIIVVIIIVLVGLYYGQQVREQEVSAARVQNPAAPADVEVSADSASRIEEGEMSVKSAESVLTDAMALNKNEVFCVQIGSADGPDSYSAERADSIISEFSSRGLYSKKIIVNPEKNQYIVQLGIFKNYDDAKSFLNSVKLKSYPAEITIVPDPNAKIVGVPKVAQSLSAKQEPFKGLLISTPDSKLIGEIKSEASAAQSKINETAPGQAAVIPVKKPADEPVRSEPQAQNKAAAAAAETKEPVRSAGNETSAPGAVSTSAPITPPRSAAEEAAVKRSKETGSAPDIKIAAAKPEEMKTPPSAVTASAEAAAEEITPKNSPKKDGKPLAGDVRPSAAKVSTPPAEEDEEIVAGEDDLEIVADDASAASEGGKGPYYIQLGTYKSNKNADVVKSKLKKMGINNVSIVPGKLASGDSVYRVRITGFVSKDAASKAFSGTIQGAFPDVKPYISK